MKDVKTYIETYEPLIDKQEQQAHHVFQGKLKFCQWN